MISFNIHFTRCCPPRNLISRDIPLIALFWHDFNPEIGGKIYYRQTNATNELNTVHQIFSSLDTGELSDFSPTHLFIATWDQVPEFDGSMEVYIKFMCYDVDK